MVFDHITYSLHIETKLLEFVHITNMNQSLLEFADIWTQIVIFLVYCSGTSQKLVVPLTGTSLVSFPQ